ncbi:MAG TPA: type II toxin-antitoxin system RelE/ParE family toxin, partial [Thermomicrobiales bacterium]
MIEVTGEFNAWYDDLDEAETHAVNAAVDFLIEGGPGLGRPFVDTIGGSRIANLKELRAKRHDIRILFAFDPRRTAILLIGGSKTNDWQGWYERTIPE